MKPIDYIKSAGHLSQDRIAKALTKIKQGGKEETLAVDKDYLVNTPISYA
ncbi:hypothetical protein [Vibrio fluvialis]|nr:hypothetical protein [Vibrio fluvialis]MCG6370119.1 hypothetical protein [Vibrio fluvialis]MCG6378867.1 hypothetical protein [Vibrio fluvialis]